MKRFFVIFLSTLSMYVVTHIIVFVLLPIGLLLAIFKQDRAIHWLKQRFVDALFWIIGKRVDVRDLEKVDPESGYLIISNYPSFYTMFLLMKLFPDASIIAAAFVSRIPFLGQFMKQIGTIFVDPKKGRKTYQAIEIALEEGVKSVIILPEGERTPDGRVQDFKRGFTYILRHSSLHLLPVTLNGFYTLKPVKRLYLNPDTNLEVVIHKPFRNSDIRKLTDRELRETAESIIKGVYRP